MATRGVSAAVIRMRGDPGKPEILLIQRKGNPDGSGYPQKWELPGGGTKPGETDEQCVVRRTLEETGLDVESLGVASHDFTVPPGVVTSQSDDACVHLCKWKGGKFIVFPTNSHLDARWVSVAELFNGQIQVGCPNPTSQGYVSRMMKMILAGFHAHQLRQSP